MNRAWSLLALSALLCPAQETRSVIYGRVLDPSGAPVASAAVRVTNLDTNTSVELKTNQTGYYEANFLLTGSYAVAAEMSGFKQTVLRGIQLPIGTRQEIDVRLELGAVSESVSVTAETPMLETDSVSSGRVIDNRSLAELPVLSNSPTLLAKFTPGVQATGTNRYLSFNSQSGASSLNTAGNVGGNDWSIDGALNASDGRQISFLPHTDTLQEMKVETSGFDASIGATTGAAISMMTKAGTNRYHGALSWMHWQQRWSGTPFFTRQLWYRRIAQAEAAGNPALAEQLRNTPKQPTGRSNNYSASLGGPVVIPGVYSGKNKMFFFFSYNGFKDTKPAEGTPQATVPTMAQRNGDFSDLLRISLNPSRFQIYDPLSVRPDPARPGQFVRSPFAGNILPRTRMVNPLYDAYAKFYPQPNSPPIDPTRDGPYNNYQATAQPYNWDYNAISSRLDYALSDRIRFFARGSWFDYKEDRNDWTYETARGLSSDGLHRTSPSGTVDWVFTPAPTTIINASGSLNHYYQSVLVKLPYTIKPTDVGLPGYLDQKAGDRAILPEIAIDGYRGIGQPTPYLRIVQTLQSRADVTHIRGSHTMRAGFDTRQYYRTGRDDSNSAGYFAFNTQFTRQSDDNVINPAGNLGHGWAAFALGMPSTLRVDTIDSFALNNPYFGWFAQDNWRVTPKLSLTLGLRMEYENGPTERYNRMLGWYDPSLRLPIADAAQAAYARSPIAELPAAQFKVQGGSVYPGVNGASRRLWNGELMFLPRLAAAYQLNSKTVLRAGFGLFYDTYNVLQRGINATGFSRSTNTVVTNDFGQTWNAGNPAAGISPLRDPFPVRFDGTRFDTPNRDALGAMQVVGRGFSYREPEGQRHARQARLRVGFQRQFGAHTVVEGGYSYANSGNVYITQNLNPLPERYWASGTVRNNDLATDMNRNLNNPFRIDNFTSLRTTNAAVYQDMTTNGFYTSPTIRKNQLLRPNPQMSSLNWADSPFGAVVTHSVEISLQRRFSKGFNLNAYYTGMRQRDRDIYLNEFDPEASWRLSNNSRPHRVSATGIWELPLGQGRRFAQTGWKNALAGGWQIGGTYEYQPGPLLNWGNLFYYGDPENISPQGQTLDQWFTTSGVACGQTNGTGFERCATRGPAAFHRRVFPTRLGDLRQASTNTWNANVLRDIRLKEQVTFQLRMDVINLFNRSEWDAPVQDPFSTNFGRITAVTSAQKRFIQIQGRIRF
ncbi:MAG: TonB-dependent receptor [Bryobacterales bacterium]|nr:TonB-dependent receptor [Bryobacterales bacterium]